MSQLSHRLPEVKPESQPSRGIRCLHLEPGGPGLPQTLAERQEEERQKSQARVGSLTAHGEVTAQGASGPPRGEQS